MNNGNINNLCSIMIPTYNRPQYLKRVLNYYNECVENFKIFIADSSEESIKKQNKQIIESFSKMNILYLDHYQPENNDYLCVMHKILDMMDHIKDKYCVYCADDDFVTPNGITQSVSFLEKNPDFSVALGKSISFMIVDNQFYWKHSAQLKSIIDSDPKDRMFSIISNPAAYPAPTGGINKTEMLKMFWKETIKYVNDGRFGELMMYPLSLAYGKMKYLDNVFFSAREMSQDSVGNAMCRFSDFITDGSFDNRYSEVKEGLAIHLTKNSKIDIDEAKYVIERGLKEFFKIAEHGQLIPKLNRILINMKLPNKIDGVVRTPYRLVSRLKAGDSLEGYDINRCFHDNFGDFYKIKKWVMNDIK